MLLCRDDIAIDVSSARPNPDALADAGVRLVSRYLSHVNDLTRPKILYRDEMRRWFDSGIAIQPNWEWYETRTFLGAAAGRDDGRECADQLAALDWPLHHFVCVSADTDTTPATHPATLDYFEAFAAELGGRPLTAYIDRDGGWMLWAAMALDMPGVWLPAASAWDTGPNYPPIYMRQWSYPRHPTIAPWVLSRQVDDNTVIMDFEAWAGELEPAELPPTQKEVSEMTLRLLHPDGRQFVATDGGAFLEPITGPAAHWIERAEGPPQVCRDAKDQEVLEEWIGLSDMHRRAVQAALDDRIRAIVDELLDTHPSGTSIDPALIRAAVRSELDSTRLTH